MKKNFLSSMLAVTMVTTAVAVPSVSFADQVTWQQRQELYAKGTITDASGKTWNVIYLPGTERVKTVSKSSFKEAWDIIKRMGQKEFWQDRYQEVKNGYETAKDATEDYWIKGMKEDYTDAKEKSASVKAGEFGAMPAKAAAWTKFGVKAVGRTVTFPIGVAYGLGVESTAIPLVSILGYPLASTVIAAGGGAVVPGVMYAWNGVAWVGTAFYSNEPTTENFFIRIKSAPGVQPKDLVIDKKGFDTLLIGSALKALNDAEIAKLGAKIDKLLEEVKSLRKTESDKYDELYANENYKQYEQLLQKAYSAKSVTLDQASHEILFDDAQLTELIKEFLKQLEVEATDERVAEVKATLKKNLEGLLKEMALAVPAKS
ncbi:MAG: hypothetical protein ACXVCR_16930 [Bdellovibrio sp.]